MFFWVESSGEFSGIVIENNKFSGNSGGSISFNGGTLSGENHIRSNTFGGGDNPPEAEGFTVEGNTAGELDAGAPEPAAPPPDWGGIALLATLT